MASPFLCYPDCTTSSKSLKHSPLTPNTTVLPQHDPFTRIMADAKEFTNNVTDESSSDNDESIVIRDDDPIWKIVYKNKRRKLSEVREDTVGDEK